jgi:hypothetical protein
LRSVDLPLVKGKALPFFQGASAGNSRSAASKKRRKPQLASAGERPHPSNGVAAQSCNPGKFGNATTTVLSDKEGDIESAALFVEGSDQLVDQAMLFGNRTSGTALTVRTTTVMNDFCHETHPL